MPKLSVLLAITLVIVCWAYSPIGIRIALQAYHPGALACLRFILASLVMGVISLFIGLHRPSLRDLGLFALLGVFAVTCHHLAINYAQRGVSAAASSVLAQTSPFFSTLITRFVMKQHIDKRHWWWLLLGMAGAMIVVAGDGYQRLGHIDPHSLLVLVAALSWSAYFVLQKQYCQQHDMFSMTCYMVWSGTLLLLPSGSGLWQDVSHASWQANSAVLLLGIFPSALAYLAWAFVLRHMALHRAVMCLYLVPLLSIVLSQLLLGEPPRMMVILGGLVIMASILGQQSGGAALRRCKAVIVGQPR